MFVKRIKKFRLNKGSSDIFLEKFIKIMSDMDDYQQIRFYIRDGNVRVNGRIEKKRRRLLVPGDFVVLGDLECLVLDESGKQQIMNSEYGIINSKVDMEHKVYHKKKDLSSLSWTEKKIKTKK